MFVLCIYPDGVVLRLVSVLYSLMVEKVESLLRGQWSAFNIYRAFSSSRLAFTSRVGVPWRLLVYCVSSVLLVSSSRRRLLVVASCHLVSFHPCVLLVADAVAISSVGRLMSVASRRECLASFLRLVSRLVSSPRSHPVPFCSCRHPWRGGGSGGAWRGCPCHHVVSGGRGSTLVFRLARHGDGARLMGNAPFYSARFLLFAFTRVGSCPWRDGIDIGRSKGTMREAIDNGKNVIAARTMDEMTRCGTRR